ncbi:MAG: rapA, partial [Marmoricola sp.]|nr:rapA [Marmoricola sp.]
MSFVPLQGRATWVPSHPPRMSEIEFSGPARTIRMPMRGAIPVLTRAIRVEDAHPSVGLLSGATLMAMKLVAAGRIRLSESGDSWRVGPLQPEDDDRLHALATARAHGETTVEDAEDLIRQLLDAVVDTVTRPPSTSPVTGGFDPLHQRDRGLRRLLETDEDPDLPEDVRITLRVEAPSEVLDGGGVVVVLQAHEVDNDSRVVDADQLWLGEGHGFSRRARVNVSIALRAAAQAWAPLDRLQRQQVPDR